MSRIIEKTKKIVVPRIEVTEYLHGHTTIDLFNVRTKKYERVEHDNHFTDGIESYLRGFGAFRNHILETDYINNNKDFWKVLIGGIFLFDTALPTSPDAKYMPAGTKMTANASYGVSNSSNPPELGSYNGVESAFTDSSMTFVYDWLTSQGNGDIASVALTTLDGGYIGYGNGSRTSATLRAITNTQSVKEYSFFADARNAKILYDDSFYMPSSDILASGATSLVIYKKSATIRKLDLISGDLNFESPTDSMTFNFDALGGAYYCVGAGAAYPSCLMLLPAYSIADGSSVVIYLLDVSDGTSRKITFTNNTGKTLNETPIPIFMINDTYLLALFTEWVAEHNQYETSFFKINYLDGTTTLSVVMGGEIRNRNANGNGLYTPELIATIGGNMDTYIYDHMKGSALPTNGILHPFPTSTQLKGCSYVTEADCLLSSRNSTGTSNVCIAHNPLRLMTINNLQSTVQKTADKTMKVTYTITRSA